MRGAPDEFGDDHRDVDRAELMTGSTARSFR
jgi:hypothetical protein